MEAALNDETGSRETPAYSDVIREIVASLSNGRLAVFCGAGISLRSGLPLASQLVGAVLEKLGASADSKKFSGLPFEAFMETLRAESHATHLLEIFKLGQQNTNHSLFAKLAKMGRLRTICTVNFDTLIEQALEAEGSRVGKDYEVTYRDQDFDAIDWKGQTRTRLIKLHGSVADPARMAITLRQVAHRSLSAQRQGVIRGLFSSGKHDDVLVLGYSCSDLFDISPHIETLADKRKRIFLVDHFSSAEGRDDGRIEKLSACSEKNPFQGFTRRYRIRCDTDALVKAIWEKCLGDPHRVQGSSTTPVRWVSIVDEWYQRLRATVGGPSAAAGHLYFCVSEFNDAATCFDRAVKDARADGDLCHVSQYLSNLGLAYTHLSKYAAAIECHEEAIQIARKTGVRRTQATNLQNMATAYQRLDLERAFALHEQAAKIASELGDPEGLAACYGAMGSAMQLGKLDEAVKYLKYALNVANDDANLAGQVAKLGDLGSAYQLVQNFAKSMEYYKIGLDLARKVGVKEAEGHMLGNIGLVYAQTGKPDQAIEHLEKSRVIAREVGNVHGEAKYLGGLAAVHLAHGEHALAVARSNEALQIARRLGMGLMGLRVAQLAAGDQESAEGCLQEARRIAKGNNHLEASIRKLDNAKV